jgi:hypothetical protein
MRVEEGANEWPQPAITIPSGGWPRNDLWPDEVNAISRRLAERWLDSQYSYSMPSRWLIGCTNPNVDERSKPVGLTTNHKYTDRDGDTIEASEADSWAEGDVVALLKATDSDSGESASVYVTPENSIPLALNVLGHDRPHVLSNFETIVGGYKAAGVVIGSTEMRDKTLANAIAYLKSVDRYDQRVAERKAEEEAKAAREAEQAARVEAKEASRQRLAEVVGHVAVHGIDRVRADALQIAVADYKKAVDAVGAPSAL